MVHVLARIEVLPGHRDDFLKEFARLTPLVRAESGCVEYVLTHNLPTTVASQEHLGENVFIVVEKWQSLDALQAHLQAPHMAEYRSRVQNIVAGVKLHILQPA